MMKKILIIISLLIFSSTSHAKKNKNTWDYPLIDYRGWVIEGSEKHYKFKSNLRQDKNVLKEFKNNKNTGIISYLLFENDQIVIDESDIPSSVQGDKIIDGMLPSHSMGKSLVSYVTGHAICEGYIDNINVKLNDWPLIQNTLYENSILLDLLNMKGGDQKWVGDRRNVGSDNRIKGEKKEENVNVIGLVKVMNNYLRGTEKSKLIYNYSALTTNVIMNYGNENEVGVGNIFNCPLPSGCDSELFRKLFQEKIIDKINIEFDIIFFSAGFEAHKLDPLASINLENDDFAWVTEAILKKFAKNIPVISVLEGGYNMDGLYNGLDFHLKILDQYSNE